MSGTRKPLQWNGFEKTHKYTTTSNIRAILILVHVGWEIQKWSLTGQVK